MNENDSFEDPCRICIVKPVCSSECNKSKSYEILITFLDLTNCVPNEQEMKECGLTIITGRDNNGRTKRRKDRKNNKRIKK